MRDTTLCWRCSAEYPASSLQCPACCAANANIDIDNACVEMADASRIDHDWRFHDDSFDHEFGVERSWHWECDRCGKQGGKNVGIRMNRNVSHACQ